MLTLGLFVEEGAEETSVSVEGTDSVIPTNSDGVPVESGVPEDGAPEESTEGEEGAPEETGKQHSNTLIAQ